jgi:hypothetical protein
MLIGEGLVGLALFALWIYCILDVISTDDALVRNLPKLVWLLIVIFLPTVGSIVWLIMGRPEKAGFHPGDKQYRAPRRPLGPDDSPTFMSEIDDRATKLRRWEDDLKRREEELKRREQGD